MSDIQVSVEHSIDNRDTALASVSKPKWMDAAVEAFDALGAAGPLTGEDVRFLLVNNGLAPPHHHNAWGALTKSLINKGRLIPTDKFVNMKAAKSHARMTRQYEVAT